ncbi:MAG: hypothetical protein KGH63_03495 [Candidatus Micrarchaeota archaeon]|nr:hypothetical protein [Candidatus Micrarchaeota archaeon]
MKLLSPALLALCLVALMLFLFGCAGPAPPPLQPVSPELIVNTTANFTENLSLNPRNQSENITVNGTLANQTGPEPANETGQPAQIQNATLPPEPPAQITYGTAVFDPTNGQVSSKVCRISVSPTVIYAGQEATIDLYAYSASNERISYLCGDEERTQGYGGLFQDQRICQFNTPGVIKVYESLDGLVCASELLTVLDPNAPLDTTPSCEVLADSQSTAPVNNLTTYSAKVWFRNYPPDTVLSWDCSWKKFSARLGDVIPSNPVNGTAVISCQYNFNPGTAQQLGFLTVYAGNNYCGDLRPPLSAQ